MILTSEQVKQVIDGLLRARRQSISNCSRLYNAIEHTKSAINEIRSSCASEMASGQQSIAILKDSLNHLRDTREYWRHVVDVCDNRIDWLSDIETVDVA
jgi:hypothetical protein